MDRPIERAYDLVELKWVEVLERGYAMSMIAFAPGVSQYVSNDDLMFEEEEENGL